MKLSFEREPRRAFVLGLTIDLAADGYVGNFVAFHLGFWTIVLKG
jgi:hypothetical protein